MANTKDIQNFDWPETFTCNSMRLKHFKLPEGQTKSASEHHLCQNCPSVTGKYHGLGTSKYCLVHKVLPKEEEQVKA
ncbi:MAG: hypothetical protein LBG88_03260 [Christensenellaceae bacterium]|jgi:hypothetical protein|nr:hypothetical protein [Christensenellaceae bacterium]